MSTPEERAANAHASIAAILGVPVGEVPARMTGGPSQVASVTCGDCGALLGDQFKPGDGRALFRAHMPVCPARLGES